MMPEEPATLLAAALRDLPEGPLGLAVSGGSDSLALLYLAADWARSTGRALRVVTVDHGLRPEAAAEAQYVAECSAQLGLSHTVLQWRGSDAQGNLMDQARQARYRLMAQWAAEHGVKSVLLAHTRDDQAETFLMRLSRGAGVDGLSAMRDSFVVQGCRFCRPLLGANRAVLREQLRQRGVAWVEDPSNQDDRFERVRARKALSDLEEIGLTDRTVSTSATHLAEARAALNWATSEFAKEHVQQCAGDLMIAAAPFALLPPELQRRLLGHALAWIGRAGYGPRGAALQAFCDAAKVADPATLAGVRMTHRKGKIYLFRELSAVADEQSVPDVPFDFRWQINGQVTEGAYVAALGKEGLQQCPNWRESGRPAAAHQADPAIWCDNRLISAPLAGFLQGWQADLRPNLRVFAKWLATR